jgi:hypothetical protein
VAYVSVSLAPVETESGVIVFVDVKVHPIELPASFRNILHASYKCPSNFSPSKFFINAQITQIGLKVSSCAFSKANARGEFTLNPV